MKKLLLVFLLLFVAIFNSSCSDKPKVEEIKISTNSWIGFTPIVYAQQKGWLKDTKLKFLWNVGLSENAGLYEKGISQGFTATQYELFKIKNRTHLKPYFLMDRSNGADVILSNITIKQMKNATKPIVCYFELASLNSDIFRAFLRENGLDKAKFEIHNASQNELSKIANIKEPILVISYEPYVTALQRANLKIVSSTKELKSINVVDAIFVDERVMDENIEDMKTFKIAFGIAVQNLKADPEEYYEVVKGYLEGQSYEEFIKSLEGIEWLHENPSPNVIEALSKQGINTNGIVR